LAIIQLLNDIYKRSN